MTNEQILELAKTCGFGVNGDKLWMGWEEQLLKFARELCDNAKWEGYYEGYEVGSIDMGDKI